MSPSEYQELVEFLGRQFTEVDRRFTQIDQRFTQVDQRFFEMDLRLTELRHEILGHFDEIHRRLDRCEQEYQAITQALRRIEAGLADERRRREILERDLAELKRHVGDPPVPDRGDRAASRHRRPVAARPKGDRSWRARTTSSTPTGTCWSRSTSGRSTSTPPIATERRA